MRSEVRDRLYARLEEALLAEPCPYDDALSAINKLKARYFERKVRDFLNNASIQEIAQAEPYKRS